MLLAALALTGRWVSRHPDQALALLRRLAAHPLVRRVRERYARQLAFLAARFSPASALGLALTAQLAVLALLGAAFAAVTQDVLGGEGSTSGCTSPPMCWAVGRSAPCGCAPC